MDTAKVANWLQIVGNLGIVIGLIMVAVQIDQASEQTRRSMIQERTDTLRELSLNRMNNEALRNTFMKLTAAGLSGPLPPFYAKLMKDAGLTESEAGILWDELLARWQFREQTILNIDQLSMGERVSFDTAVRSNLERPWERLWYDSTKPILNPDAVRYLDNLLAQPSPSAQEATP